MKRFYNIAHYSFDFLEKRELLDCYTRISTKENTEDNFTSIPLEKNKNLHRVYNIPPYLDLTLDSRKHKKIELKEIDKGLLIDISQYKTIDEYTLNQFSSRKRKQIRSALKRINICFNISYKTYYGEINRTEYNKLLSTSKEFIKRRFEQINKKHFHLENWDLLEKRTYDLVIEKKASIFVIYNDEEPINICFNYHFKDTTCNLFAAYDIDYAKFSLGTIDLYKQIEWNINNGFSIFDMSLGESDYKFLWSNKHYSFKHHLIIKRTSVSSHLLGLLMFFYLKIRFKLYRYYYKNPDSKLMRFLNLKTFDPENDNEDIEKPSVIIEKEDYPKASNYELDDFRKINYMDAKFSFLRKTLYDYLHANSENKNDIEVYKSIQDNSVFLIKGHKTLQQLRVKV